MFKFKLEEKTLNDIEKINEIDKKMAAKAYQPTMNELWFTGYQTGTGKVKAGIFQTKLSEPDKAKLKEVYEAIQTGELPHGVEDMKKFTKTHALRLYKVLQEKRKAGYIKEIIENMPDNYKLINDFDLFSEFLVDLRKEEEFAIDTETTGLNYFETAEASRDVIVGLSFTLPVSDYHVYIPVRHTEGKQLPAEYVFEKLKPILENPAQKKILFNAKFDCHMLLNEGINLNPIYFDGYVAMKLLNENEESYALKNLANKYGKHFGFKDESMTYEALFGKGGFQDTPFITSDGKRHVAVYYTCKDTHLTYRFYKDFVMKHFDRLPDLKKLYFEIEAPITEISIEMERNGFRIDFDFAETYAKELKQELEGLDNSIRFHLGNINLNSPSQLSEVLYDKLKLPDVSKKRSTDAKTLKKLAAHNEGIALLLKYRDLNKLLTTYIEPMPLKTSEGYLHGRFEQVSTATGRFASSAPNLQNLPLRARRMIISSENMIIVGIDYSQIEPRVLGHMTGDESLIEAYVMQRDLYVEMAMKTFKLEREYCVDGAYSPDGKFQPRKAIKAVLLGIMYGMGSASLAGTVGVSIEEADGIISDFYAAYPKVEAWIKKIHEEVAEKEYVQTMYGRKRRFVGHRINAKRFHAVAEKLIKLVGHIPSNIWDEKYKHIIPYQLKQEYWNVAGHYHRVNRQAVNTMIQGSAADLMKLALIASREICRKYGWKQLATIHDEILFELPVDVTPEQIEELEASMLGIVQLAVPLKVDTAVMTRWGDEIKKDEWYGEAS